MTDRKSVSGVTVSPTTLSLALNGTSTLTATVLPGDAANKTVTWSSGNTNVATVDSSSGTVTGRAAGTAVITATTQDGSKTASCTVTVSNVTMNTSTMSLTVSGAGNLSVNGTTVKPSWSSSNSSYATVDGNGRVTGIAPGTATITATVTVNNQTYRPTCTVTVSGTRASDVSYTTPINTAVTFSSEDFNTVCSNAMGRSLSNISITSLPSSSYGTLYYNYRSNSSYDRTVTTGTSYYYSSSYYLSYITFVPANNYTGTVTIPYVGRDNRNSSSYTYSGNIVITVGGAGEVSYTTSANTPVALDNNAFNSYCQSRTGYNFNYVKFTPPVSSRGYLYYNYSSSGNYDSQVSSSTRYYRNSSPRLDNITFVPADGYTGTLSIPFTGENANGTSFSGTLSIAVGKSGGDITYTTAVNTAAGFNDQDFIDFCKDRTGYTLDYVTFTLPASSRGTLYHNYKSSSSTGTKVSSSTRYYRNSSPYVDDVSFVPANNYTGTVSISFTGRSSNNNSISGTVKIYVGSGVGDVTLSTRTGTPLALNDDNFNSYCKSETGSNLDYVRFSLPAASKGTLYYNYKSSTSTGTKVSSTTSYYRSSSPRLDDVNFVPAGGYSGTLSIDFTGRSTANESFTGTLVVKVAGNVNASVINYSSTGMPVSFRSDDFTRALDGRSVQSVSFTLPGSDTGRLYYNYTSPTTYDSLVSSSTRYLRSGSPSLSSVVFVPKAGFSGTASISYSGTDTDGGTYTGTLQIAVSPVTRSQYFGDMGSYDWAAASVDFLYQSGVVTGVGANQYGPARAISRGDFVLMLYRAFKLNGRAGDNFPDVPSNSYYATAISVAKSLGIAKGTDGKFNPTGTLTRQDAMVLIQRTIQVTGGTMNDGSSSTLNAYPDGSSVSDYAGGAVSALAQAGIIKGDDSRRINPKGSITRAEMAVILHRVITL